MNKEFMTNSRKDAAKVKRVELRAHTQMSMRDSVLSVEELIKTAAEWGWEAVAITDSGVVQAFPKAAKILQDEKLNIKVIYGMAGHLVEAECKAKKAQSNKTAVYQVSILAKNQTGLINLYRLISMLNIETSYRQMRIPKDVLQDHREGLIIGSGCYAGELICAIVNGKTEEELLNITNFYDYLEIQPIGNSEVMKRSDSFPNINTDDDLRQINIKIAEIAKKLNKPLVATGDVHYLNPDDAVCRSILWDINGLDGENMTNTNYLRTTEEMLKEFEYLGEDTAYEAVVTNSRRIASEIEKIKPLPDCLYDATFPNAVNDMKELSYKQAHNWYGEKLPNIVQDRLEQELSSISRHGYAPFYMAAQQFANSLIERGYLFDVRGTVGSSLVANLMGITNINPLPPHWRCPNCQYSEFNTDGSYMLGLELPNKNCPHCGETLIKDGYNIHSQIFLKIDGAKIPHIVFLCSDLDYYNISKRMEEFLGDGKIFKALEILTYSAPYGRLDSDIQKYFNKKGNIPNEEELQRIAAKCIGAKRYLSMPLPQNFVVIPQDLPVDRILPIHNDSFTPGVGQATHFDFRDLSVHLVNFNVHGSEILNLVKLIKNLTDFLPENIPFDDSKTISLFRSTEALGISPEKLGVFTGTLGIPHFQSVRYILEKTNPTRLNDILKTIVLNFSDSSWFNNVENLIRNKVCELKDAVATVDDIIIYLTQKGVPSSLAYEMAASVRAGNGINPEVVNILKNYGIPDWYIESCQKIRCLYLRNRAIPRLVWGYRIAYYKLYYPIEFYTAYFAVGAHLIDEELDLILKGKDEVKEKLKELSEMEAYDPLARSLRDGLQVAYEMYLRGYELNSADIRRCRDEFYQGVDD